MLGAETIIRFSATELTSLIRARTLTARAVVEACLWQINRSDGRLRAFITISPESALAEADRLDGMAERGQFAGALHGIPFAVKDLIPTANIRTTRGSALYEHDVPDEDDVVVARLKAAGGILIGKTNTPEFGFGALCRNVIAGNTVNPYAPDCTSGGSSGGSAVAVATGMVPLALGTDFGGSVRTPASFCDVIGIRPAVGTVPRVSKQFLWETLASFGVMARTVSDAELMLAAIAGSDVRDPVSMGLQAYQSAQLFSRNDLRLAASVDLGVATIAREVSDIFDLAIDRISRMGFVVEAQHPDFTGVQQAFETLRAGLLFHEFGSMIEDASSDVSATVRWNVERGRNVYLKDVLQAETIRTRLYRNCAVFFEGFDFLLLPSASVAPWPLSQADVDSIDDKPTNNIIDYLTITYAISLVGLPVMSIPCGWTPDGRPIGMQIVAGPGRNGDLLAFAALLEQDDGFRHRFPA